MDKGKKQKSYEVEDMEGVELRASDPSLLGVKMREKAMVWMSGKSTQSQPSKTIVNALKDVTNVLEVRPIKLKPNWVGFKNGKGPAVREIGPVSNWVALGGT